MPDTEKFKEPEECVVRPGLAFPNEAGMLVLVSEALPSSSTERSLVVPCLLCSEPEIPRDGWLTSIDTDNGRVVAIRRLAASAALSSPPLRELA